MITAHRHRGRGLLWACVFASLLIGCSGGESAKTPGPTVVPPVTRASIQLTADSDSAPADGVSTVEITATVRDAAKNIVPDGTTVTFSVQTGPSDPGEVSPTTADTVNGQAQTTYTAGTTGGTVTVRATATVGTETVRADVTISLQGATIELTAAPSVIEAGGAESLLTARVRYAGGSVVPVGTVVTFETTLGILSSGQAQTNTQGEATVTLTSSASSGTATVTASALDASQTVNVSFTELPPTVNTIEMSELETAQVGVLGSSEAQTSRIKFLVKDLFGSPVSAGYSIEFVLLSGPNGGEQIFPQVAQTDSSGEAEAIFTGGTVSGTARIVARYRENPTIVSNAVVITIRAGLPDGLDFGVYPELLNIAGRRFFGLQDPITACPSDSYLNDVPDGTAVYFTTDYGNINAAGTTTAGCTVSELQSQNPLPPGGLVTYQAATQSGVFSRILCITVDPDDASTVWVGTDGDGIFRSIDAGTRWLHVGSFDDGLTNGIVRSIVLDPGDTRIVYAGTDGGVFKSVGGGEWEDLTGWKRITGEFLGTGETADTDGASATVYALQYRSTQQRARTRVYVDGAETTAYFYTSAEGIRMIGDLTAADVITIDYDLALEFPSQYPVNGIAVETDLEDPIDGSTVYAGTGGGGVYKSEDGGFTWAAVNRGMSNQEVLSLVREPLSGTLYVGTRGGVFRSTDGGAVWTRRITGLTDLVVQSLDVDATRVFAGTATRGVFWSSNSGNLWLPSTTNVNAQKTTNGDVTSVQVATPTVLYAATRNGGVFRGALNGASLTWSPLTNVFGESLGTGDGQTQDFDLMNDSNRDKLSTHVYLDSEELPHGAYLFKDADTISLFTPPTTGTAVSVDYVLDDYPSARSYAVGLTASGGVLYAGGYNRNLVKSSNEGASWITANGTGISRIENDVYATAKAIFSGSTVIRILPLFIYNPDNIAGEDDLFGIRVDGTHYGVSYPVEFGGSQAYLFTISDFNGNPLVGGSTLEVQTDCSDDVVRLTGDLGDTIADALRGETGYAFSAANVNEGETGEICVFSLTVTSDADALDQGANGSEVVNFSQTFWAKLAVNPAEAEINPDESQKLTATGGSGTYQWTGNGTAVGDSFFFVPPGGIPGVYSVVVRDMQTGEQAGAFITVKVEEG